MRTVALSADFDVEGAAVGATEQCTTVARGTVFRKLCFTGEGDRKRWVRYCARLGRAVPVTALAVVALPGLMGATACGGARKPTIIPYSRATSTGRVYVQEKNGLTIAVDPIADGRRATEYFGADVLGRGKVFAIHVTVQNSAPHGSIIVRKQNMAIVGSDRTVPGMPSDSNFGSAPTDPSSGSFTILSPLATTAIFGMIVGGEVLLQNADVQEALVRGEFRDATLQPGQSADGFAYFPAADGRPATGTLRLKVFALATQEEIEMQVPLTP